MTAATAGPSGPNLFTMFSGEKGGLYQTRRETFAASLLGQAAVLGLIIYFTSCVIIHHPPLIGEIPKLKEFPLIFSGNGGGGGGNHDPQPASRGNPPRASLEDQLVPPMIVPTETHRLMRDETVVVAPDVPMPVGGPIGDPLSKFSALSQGPGGLGGWGEGCCNGIGPSRGPHVGPGPEGVRPGVHGATVPQVIYNPEPTFSEEARKTKQQGKVTLWLVVGADGRTYNIRVGQGLGYGLDEEAIKAVSQWRFKPATLNGQPVATQIAVEVDFHLY